MQSSQSVYRFSQHPLLLDMVSGKLSSQLFQQFSSQDVLFLDTFSRAYCELALRCTNFETFHKLLLLAKSTAEERQQLASLVPSEASSTGATNAYIRFLQANLQKSWSPFACMAAMVPCMKLYAYIGEQKRKDLGHGNFDSTTHPYQWWITFYASEDFQQSTRIAEELLDYCETEYLEEALQTYIQAMYFEKQFFDNSLLPLHENLHPKED
ncbi:Probable aminopyrimidine aminohydrolase, mitochondrial [Galdieria sulphuraria]|nr:Probable aminopyrimidine aminohydrolase, mitochondrial [Galdieria sulphuraria]